MIQWSALIWITRTQFSSHRILQLQGKGCSRSSGDFRQSQKSNRLHSYFQSPLFLHFICFQFIWEASWVIQAIKWEIYGQNEIFYENFTFSGWRCSIILPGACRKKHILLLHIGRLGMPSWMRHKALIKGSPWLGPSVKFVSPKSGIISEKELGEQF